MIGWQRLPDAELERALLAQPLPDAEGAEPAVLVVHGRDSAGHGDAYPLARRLDQLVLRRPDVRVAEVPGALFPQHAGRLAGGIANDHAAFDLEIAVRTGERGRVEPQRVVVPGHQGGGPVAGDPVERLLRRLDRRRPVAAAPARAAEPAAGLDLWRGGRDALERLVKGGRALEADVPLRERPGREVHMR